MMITVNLRPGQKRKAAGGGSKQFLERVKALGTKVKDPLLVGAVAACLVVTVGLGWAFISANSKYNALAPQLEAARDEQKRFDNLLRQKRRAEGIRDSLLAQIATIRGVDGNRYVWPHVLEKYRRIVVTGRLVKVVGQLQREGLVTHIVAHRLFDLSDYLDGLSRIDAPFENALARADEVARPGRDHRDKAARRTPALDVMYPSRDFH